MLGRNVNFGRLAIHFAITHVYTTNGHRSSLTTPGGFSIGYAPNALGQPTTAGSLASSITHHPNGAVAGLTYGNGATRTVTLTPRQWPQRIRDAKGGTPLLDHTLSYDLQGNLVDLDDGLLGALESRSFAYDTRDRLTTVTAAATHAPDRRRQATNPHAHCTECSALTPELSRAAKRRQGELLSSNLVLMAIKGVAGGFKPESARQPAHRKRLLNRKHW